MCVGVVCLVWCAFVNSCSHHSHLCDCSCYVYQSAVRPYRSLSITDNMYRGRSFGSTWRRPPQFGYRHRSTPTYAEILRRRRRWYRYSDKDTDNDGVLDETQPQEPVPSREEKDVLNVESVDFNVAANAKAHRTSDYAIVESVWKPKLVVRRGQSFDITIEFNRKYDKSKDDLRLIFEMGDRPLPSKGTYVEFILSAEDLPDEWGAKIQDQNGSKLTVTVFTPPDCYVAKWMFRVDVVKRDEAGVSVFRYEHKDPIYMIFNPWCKNDGVYNHDNSQLEEYVLNEVGKIYVGTYQQISSRPWNFAQFQGTILDCAMDLLDSSKLSLATRGNAIAITRKLTSLVNHYDNKGVVTGNWSDDFSGGSLPTRWIGSEAILDEYYRTKQPVKFGQCWVFSGILTTLCRTLGIPCRSVTNFRSAHDTDGSITIDVHWSPNYDEVSEINEDSIWNFHVWNEAWMARPDLPLGYGGWQAIDATPQEVSDGMFCMGPVSLVAIRKGDVHLMYDGPFCFAEVNADRVHWLMSADGNLSKAAEQTGTVGKNISTKRPKTMTDSRGLLEGGVMSSKDPDRLDVTDLYKHPEGSQEERAAVFNAHRKGSSRLGIYEQGSQDVKFTLSEKNDVMIGKDFEITLSATNTSKDKRTIEGCLSAASIYYTGVHAKAVKKESFSLNLEPKGTGSKTVIVSVGEYLDNLVGESNMKISCLAVVKETNQVYAEQDDFRLRKPHLTIKAPASESVGAKMKVEMSFVNPLARPLTSCELIVEGPGLTKSLSYPQGSVGSQQTFTFSFELTPAKPGERQIMANFNSTELHAVNGVHTVKIKA